MSYDIFCLCNPLVDILVEVDDPFLAKMGVTKNSMQLINKRQWVLIDALITAGGYAKRFDVGGSGANTAALIAECGASVAFGGKIASDETGEVFQRSLEASGCSPQLSVGSGETGSTLVLVTPDAARTMCTHLGVAQDFGVADLNGDALRASKLLYLTSYCFDVENQRAAALEAVRQAKENRIGVALSFSDSFCVSRHKALLKALIKQADLALMNRDEALSMTDTTDVAEAMRRLRATLPHVVITLGAEGVMGSVEGEDFRVPALETEVLDTTGAGDSFAAGYLYGLTTGKTPAEAARLGAMLAAGVVSQWGGRLKGDVRAMLSEFR